MAFRDAPIRRKLMTMLLSTSGAVLLLTCAAFIGSEFLTYRSKKISDLATLGEIFAAQSTSALAFDNQRDATENLASLRAEPHIVAACLYDRRGLLFARYPANAPDSLFPHAPGVDGHRFVDGHLHGFTPVVQVQGSERFGTLFLDSDMGEMNERLRLYGWISLLVLAISLSFAYVLSRILQHQISRPIIGLADIAKAVSERRDYSVRAKKFGDDEVGLLTEAFNQMLAEIALQNAVLEERVRARTAELEAANDELEAFCSSAAHDLRTPLRAITGFADLLIEHRADTLQPDVRRHIELIRAGSHEASQLVYDLLSFSRLGRAEMAVKIVDADKICQDALKDFKAEIRERKVDLEIDPLPEVIADPALLRVVFVNLLSNALKYSRPRTPAVIRVGLVPESDETQPIFFVRDNGVGFDMKDSAKLFGVFQRFHHAHEFEGTGVGLATVRRIIERHGGRIWAEAAPNAGATFFFTLPKRSGPPTETVT